MKPSKIQQVLRKVRREANNWTPEYRAELHKKGLDIINAGTKRPTKRKK